MFKTKNKKPLRNPGGSQEGEYVFRRSRTITGTSSEKINTSAPVQGQLKTKRLKLHALQMYRLKALRGLLMLGAVFVFGLFLVANYVNEPSLGFTNGANSPDAQKYKQTILKYYGEHPFERFGFAAKEGNLEDYLKDQHHEIKDITLDRAWFGKIDSFKIFFRQPVLSWQVARDDFFVDNQGIAFTYNHFKKPAVKVTDRSGVNPSQGGALTSGRFIAFLGQLVGALESYNKGKVTSIAIPRSTRQIDLKLKGRDYVIKTNIDRKAEQQAEDIANTLDYLDRKKIKPKYIDVRVPHKAFYKL